jgi:hypothetical protein
MADSVAETASRFPAGGRERFARFGKYSFWIWIGYQTIKGTLTMTFIWVPLLYMHFHG